MKVPFWEPGRNYRKHKTELNEAIERVLENGQLIQGFSPDIELLERDFAKFVGVSNAIFCGAGTQALYLAYRGLGIGPGDEVITVSHTFAATIDQIVAVGAIPVLVDIGEDGLIDPVLVEKAITSRTKAIVPVHLEGKVCNMAALHDLAHRYNLLIIEDAAQAIGASFGGNKTGSMGDAGCFSLFPAKIFGGFGNGGMITTNNQKLADKLRLLRCNFNLGKNQELESGDWGMNMEGDGIQAAILNVKFPHLKDYLSRRAVIAAMYDTAFSDLPITLPHFQEGRVYQDYVIRTDERDQLAQHLIEKGVGVLGHNLVPNHHYPKLGLHFYLPRTEDYIRKQIRIPCNPELTDEEVAYVAQTIKDFYTK